MRNFIAIKEPNYMLRKSGLPHFCGTSSKKKSN